jgi:hypothetical protein
MSGWRIFECGGDCVRHEQLYSDSGKFLGEIQRFYADGPTYAWCSVAGRLGGAWENDARAREAVEASLEAKP